MNRKPILTLITCLLVLAGVGYFPFFAPNELLAEAPAATDEPITTNAAKTPPAKKVYVIPVAGDVEPAMAAFISRAFRDAAMDTDALFVLEIDTFGGRVDTALRIVDILLTEAPGKTISYVKTKAISAGALIALSGNELVMRHNTTIGDCAPITYTDEGPKMLGEKMQSPLRATFRTLARRNGYPVSLSEAMVTLDMEVLEVTMENEERMFLDSRDYKNLSEDEKSRVVSKKVVVEKGELLTMDDSEALSLGFSRMSAESIDLMLRQLKIDNYTIIRVEPSWSENMSSLINMFAPFLIMIGLAGLYTELKSPGFGVPGLLGVICLGLVFLNQYLVGLADHTEFLLVMLGIVLLGLEIFVIPGFGVAGILGFCAILFGIILSFQDFVLPSPDMPWQGDLFVKNSIRVLSSGILAFCCSLAIVRYLIPRFGMVADGPYLHASLEESHADSEEVKKAHIGDIGKTISPVRPAGKMRLGHEIIDVVSEAEFIDKEVQVKIIDIQGNRVIVRRVTE